jgi:hypothetical protein
MADIFERLAQGRPPQKPHELTPPLAQTLNNWLQRGWTQPTISAREIHRLGPNSIRDRKSVGNSTEILVKLGWLVPIKTRRRDMKKWQITKIPEL